MVQKALASLSNARRHFIVLEALDKFTELASDANGLCLIKKLLPLTRSDPKLAASVMNKITKSSIELAQNPYGNYAIQVVLELFSAEECVPLLESLRGKYTQLSMLKFSSNAIERCIEKASPKMQNDIIKEIISSDKFLSMLFVTFNSHDEEQFWKLRDTEDIEHIEGGDEGGGGDGDSGQSFALER